MSEPTRFWRKLTEADGHFMLGFVLGIAIGLLVLLLASWGH